MSPRAGEILKGDGRKVFPAWTLPWLGAAAQG